ncbi:hypothetical protein MHYP_G00257410 [Metynnis hypsauchen]
MCDIVPPTGSRSCGRRGLADWRKYTARISSACYTFFIYPTIYRAKCPALQTLRMSARKSIKRSLHPPCSPLDRSGSILLKDEPGASTQLPPDSQRGYSLCCDSPALFRDLFKMKFGACGTVRETRFGYPKTQHNCLTTKGQTGSSFVRSGWIQKRLPSAPPPTTKLIFEMCYQEGRNNQMEPGKFISFTPDAETMSAWVELTYQIKAFRTKPLTERLSDGTKLFHFLDMATELVPPVQMAL